MKTRDFARQYFHPIYIGGLSEGKVQGTFGDLYIQWGRSVEGGLEYRLSLTGDDYGLHVPEEVRHPSLGRIILFLNEWIRTEGGDTLQGKWGFQKISAHTGAPVGV